LKLGHLSILSHFLIAATICLVLAALSWHLIEKRALQWKHYLKTKHQRPALAEGINMMPMPAA
jgi:hypothetical protein